jgi:hypothetical protein
MFTTVATRSKEKVQCEYYGVHKYICVLPVAATGSHLGVSAFFRHFEVHSRGFGVFILPAFFVLTCQRVLLLLYITALTFTVILSSEIYYLQQENRSREKARKKVVVSFVA